MSSRVRPALFLFPLLASLLGAGLPSFARVLYVKRDASGPSHDGATWATAYTRVTEALYESRQGDEIRVAAGVFTGYVALRPGVRLLGGYAGTGDLRNTALYETVLDGGGQGRAVAVPSGCGRDTVIDGFTIRNGKASGYDYGGGVWIVDGSPTISNCRLTANLAYGGFAISVAKGSPLIAGNRITGNGNTKWESNRGVIACGEGATPVIERNIFADNLCGEYGTAGIYCTSAAPVIRSNLFVGGGVYSERSSPVVLNNTFVEAARLLFSYSGSPVIAGNIVAWATTPEIDRNTGTTVSAVLRNNCFWRNAVGRFYGVEPAGSDGNFLADPLFADRAGRDYRLRPASPCIDAGAPDQPAGTQDLDGRPRAIGPYVDIGAYESPATKGSVNYRIVRVSPRGNDLNDGSSWAAAKATVQAAVGAVPFHAGGEVWVAAGAYRENVAMSSWASLYGGFAGNESRREQRDWARNPTVLDGSAGGVVVTIPRGAAPGSIALDGFTIRNGRETAASAGVAGRRGGGIYIEGSSPTVAHNVISGNSAWEAAVETAQPVAGGGLYIKDGSPVVLDNVILGNTAGAGGGVAVTGPASTPLLVNNTIAGNSAGFGAGVHIGDGATVTMVNNIVAFNGSGIAVDTAKPAAFVLRSNDIFGNLACDIRGLPEPFGADGNIRADPGFQNFRFGDVRLQPTSPCRDAGDPAAVTAGDRDVSGYPRVLGRRVDMGAFEFGVRAGGVFIPRIVRVRPDGDDRASGANWKMARRTIQAAVDAVAANGGGEVWVARGVYTRPVVLKPFVYLYGGFIGTETRREQRDWKANATVLDGEGRIPETETPILRVDGAQGGAGLDGFTVRNQGYIIVPPKNWTKFGPAVAVTGRVTLENDVFLNNPGSAVQGRNATIVMRDCVLAGNAGTARYSSSPSAGAAAFDRSSVLVERCVIAANGGSGSEPRAGVGLYALYSFARIRNNTIAGNGGAGVSLRSCEGDVRNNVIKGNVQAGASVSAYGGGLYATACALTIVNNSLVANSPCGMYISYDAGSTVANNLIADSSRAVRLEPQSSKAPTFRNNGFIGGETVPNVLPGSGNFRQEPRMAGARYGDVHLQPDSPYIDRGDDAFAGPSDVDLDGQPRRMGEHVDVGADESDGTLWTVTPLVVRVRPGGSDAADGLTWETAKASVNGALAALAVRGGEVWIAAGVYPERTTLTLYNSLCGGFAGTEMEREQRDWRRNITLLGGAGISTIVTMLAGSADNVLDGVTVNPGVSPGLLDPVPGGAVATYGSVTVANNRILMSSSGGVVVTGGAPQITGNRIEALSAGRGIGVNAQSSKAVISSNLVTGGVAGVYLRGSVDAKVYNNTLVGNGAGVDFSNTDKVSIVNNIVAFGTTGFDGGTQPLYGCAMHNCLYGLKRLVDGAGTIPENNLLVDPRFVDPANGDYHLLPQSALIDRGYDAVVPKDAKDLDGRPRIIGPHVDIGAYETTK
jgi:nitrous oxidase accessory protein NosD